MKRLLSITLAAVISATAVTATARAQPYQPGPPPGYGHPPGPGPGWHHWHRGDRYYGDRHLVHDWHRYRLGPPPPGYQWVRNGGEFVLIGIGSGIVASIILNSQYH